MRKLAIALVAAAGLFAAADDGAYNRGELLFFSKGCSSCHGPDAEGSSTYPRLANRPKGLLLQKLRGFKAGRADTVSQQMMAQFIRGLDAQEIEDLATFLSEHKASKTQEVDDDILGGFGS